MARGVYPESEAPKKKDDYYGRARFERTLPPMIGKSLNVEISYEDALKLSMALQTCLQDLSRYHRGTKAGREMGLLLSIKADNSTVAVIQKAGIRRKSASED